MIPTFDKYYGHPEIFSIYSFIPFSFLKKKTFSKDVRKEPVDFELNIFVFCDKNRFLVGFCLSRAVWAFVEESFLLILGFYRLNYHLVTTQVLAWNSGFSTLRALHWVIPKKVLTMASPDQKRNQWKFPKEEELAENPDYNLLVLLATHLQKSPPTNYSQFVPQLKMAGLFQGR